MQAAAANTKQRQPRMRGQLEQEAAVAAAEAGRGRRWRLGKGGRTWLLQLLREGWLARARLEMPVDLRRPPPLKPQFEVIRAIVLDDSPCVLHEQSTYLRRDPLRPLRRGTLGAAVDFPQMLMFHQCTFLPAGCVGLQVLQPARLACALELPRSRLRVLAERSSG